MTSFRDSDFTFKRALERSEALKEMGNNALLVFTLGLYLLYEDLIELAADSLTDGTDDKKCDACRIDTSERRAIVVQGYCAETWGKAAAKANKASDLNTAMSWLLSASIEEVPAQIRPKAQELREAIKDKVIDRIDILYIHNCFESTNVEDELRTVANATTDKLAALGGSEITVNHKEFGLKSIEELYKSSDKPIAVEDEIEVDVSSGCIEKEVEGWRSVVVTVSGKWLKELYSEHGDELFSANVRDFLGITRRRGNINADIRKTAASEPKNFWVFNNGITTLTNSMEVGEETIKLQGISIINGAQTTGALGETELDEDDDVDVLCRIVECPADDLVQRIIRYNNTQNVIRPSDLRSGHPVQKRLEEAFQAYGITYVVRRSSGRNPKNAISAEATAPALCALHGDPQTATRNRRDIFEVDNVFDSVFPANITAEHVYLTHAIGTAFDTVKLEHKMAVADDTATSLQEDQYEVLRYAASRFFLLYVFGQLAEELLNRRVSSVIEWRATTEVMTSSEQELIDCCQSALRTLLPLIATHVKTVGLAYDVTRSKALSEDVAQALKGTVASLEESMGEQFKALRNLTKL